MRRSNVRLMSRGPLDANAIKRLMIIKMFYGQGVEQARLPYPLSMGAVLTFHDSVELFLNLAADVLNVDLGVKPEFLSYWSGLAKGPDGVNLTSRGRMDSLNKLRVGFKHSGNLPNQLDIERSARAVEGFFEDNTPTVFGMSFTDITMVDLIVQEKAREFASKAAESRKREDYTDSIAWSCEAFDWLLDDYVSRKRSGFNPSPYTFEDSWRPRTNAEHFSIPRGYGQHDRQDNYWKEDLQNVIRDQAKTIQLMQQGLRVMSLGIDYSKYARLARLRPHIIYTGREALRIIHAREGVGVSDDDCRFAEDFVISTAIQLASADYEVKHVDD